MTFALPALAHLSLSVMVTFLEVALGAFLFARHQPKKRPYVLCTLVMSVLLGIVLSASFVLTARGIGVDLSTYDAADSIALGEMPRASMPSALALCATALVAMIPVLLASYGISIWAAAYCATAGYILQNIGSGLGETVTLLTGPLPLPGGQAATTLLSCLIVYALAYALCLRRLDLTGLSRLEGRSSRVMLLMVVAVVFGVIGFDLVLKHVAGGPLSLEIILSLRVFHAMVCVFILVAETELVVVRQLAAEKTAAERLLAERERQYDLSRANIEAINIKCHDLRHQIRTLASGNATVDPTELESIAHEINVYDSKVRTGNDALDTILTEKSLLCEQQHITLTCVADGTALDFMAPADLYALFGNALDNAIEAVAQLDDESLRSISLIVRKRAGMVSIHIENYRRREELAFQDGMPQSTKGDSLNHGFGTRSMRAIVERYGGTLTLSARTDTFCLDALLPQSQAFQS